MSLGLWERSLCCGYSVCACLRLTGMQVVNRALRLGKITKGMRVNREGKRSKD